MPLRLDFDANPGTVPVATEEAAGAAAARWLPDGLKAVEAGREPVALRVCESSYDDQEIPAQAPSATGPAWFPDPPGEGLVDETPRQLAIVALGRCQIAVTLAAIG